MPLCTETTKAGEPCRAQATASGKCAGHEHLGAISAPRASQQKSLAVRRERAKTRALSFQDHVAAELEREAERYVATMRQATDDGDWRAMEAWVTRVLGKPVERVETVDSTTPVAELTAEQRAQLRDQALRKLTLVSDADNTTPVDPPGNAAHPDNTQPVAERKHA